MSITSSISDAKLAANRANARLSTGPNTPEGRKAASRNSVTHGLSASPEALFAAHPDERQAYESHAEKLRHDCQPSSNREDDAFQRYAWASFQAKRARNLETLSQDRWLEDPDNPKRFSQMERMVELGCSLERRADKAINELRQLQRDRFVIGNHQTNPILPIKSTPSKTTSAINKTIVHPRNTILNSNKRGKPNEANPRQYLLIGQHVKLAHDTKIST